MTEDTVPVLACAFGFEPAFLVGRFVGKRFVLVDKDGKSSGIGYPRRYLFEWDTDLALEIRKAWEANDLNEVCRLWQKAKLFKGDE